MVIIDYFKFPFLKKICKFSHCCLFFMLIAGFFLMLVVRYVCTLVKYVILESYIF